MVAAGAAAPLPRRVRQRFSPAVLILIALLLAMIAPPLVNLLETSFYTTTFLGERGEFTWQYMAGIFGDPQFARYAWRTLVYSVSAAALAIMLGVGQAWIVERTDTPGRKYVFLLSIISIGVPGVLYTGAWILILGKSGPVNQILMALTGAAEPPINVYSMGGMIVIEAINWAPLAFLLISSVFRSADSSFEEASMMSGAGIGRTFRDITLRLAGPAVLALALLITIRAFESFEVPALVGMPGNVYLLTTEIYSEINFSMPPDLGLAAAFSIGLLVVVTIMLHFYNRLSRHAARYQTITGKGYRPRPLYLGKWRYVSAAALALFFVIIIVAPIGMLGWMSLMPHIQQISLAGLDQITLKNYRAVFGTVLFADAVRDTLILSVGAATLTTALSVVCAWLVVRRYRGAWLLDQLATVPLVLPAIVLGLALLQLYLRLPFPFYGTLLSIIYASCIRFLPYGMRYTYAGVIQIHTELEQASLISGARQTTTFLRIVAPLTAPALATCWLFVFLLAAGSVSLPILLSGPNSQLVAVLLFTMYQNGSLTELSALGLCWTAFMTVVSALFYIVTRRYGVTVS